MSVKKLLTVTAIFEGITGLARIIVPSLFASLLIGTSLVDPAGILVNRLTGVALLTLAIICWLYRSGSSEPAGIIKALVFDNIAASSYLYMPGRSDSQDSEYGQLRYGILAWGCGV